MNYISDFKINPITGEFYWVVSAYNGGIYYYDVSNNQVATISQTNGVNGNDYKGLCFKPNGDLSYSKASVLYDASGNSVYTHNSYIDKVHYYPTTNSFIMCSTNEVFDDQGNILFTVPSGGGSIYALDVNYTTQRILFNTDMATVSMDINGDNVNYNGVYPARIESIGAIE